VTITDGELGTTMTDCSDYWLAE